MMKATRSNSEVEHTSLDEVPKPQKERKKRPRTSYPDQPESSEPANAKKACTMTITESERRDSIFRIKKALDDLEIEMKTDKQCRNHRLVDEDFLDFEKENVDQPFVYAHEWFENYKNGSDPRIPVNAGGVSLANAHGTKCGCFGHIDESLLKNPDHLCITKILVDFLDRSHEKVRDAERNHKRNQRDHFASIQSAIGEISKKAVEAATKGIKELEDKITWQNKVTDARFEDQARKITDRDKVTDAKLDAMGELIKNSISQLESHNQASTSASSPHVNDNGNNSYATMTSRTQQSSTTYYSRQQAVQNEFTEEVIKAAFEKNDQNPTETTLSLMSTKYPALATEIEENKKMITKDRIFQEAAKNPTYGQKMKDLLGSIKRNTLYEKANEDYDKYKYSSLHIRSGIDFNKDDQQKRLQLVAEINENLNDNQPKIGHEDIEWEKTEDVSRHELKIWVPTAQYKAELNDNKVIRCLRVHLKKEAVEEKKILIRTDDMYYERRKKVYNNRLPVTLATLRDPRDTKVCRFCGTRGHLEKECRKKAARESTPQ